MIEIARQRLADDDVNQHRADLAEPLPDDHRLVALREPSVADDTPPELRDEPGKRRFISFLFIVMDNPNEATVRLSNLGPLARAGSIS